MTDHNWADLPTELLTVIAQKLSLMEDSVLDIINFKGVCKSWKVVILNLNSEEKPLLLRLTEEEKEWWPPKYPSLLLAESTTTMISKWNNNYMDSDDHKDGEDDEEGYDDEDDWDKHNEQQGNEAEAGEVSYVIGDNEETAYHLENNSPGNIRGLFSLSTRKTHVCFLPEGAGRIISGTNFGWLVTIGKDLQLNLLHPLLRRRIPLPHMLTYPIHEEFDENYTPEKAFGIFLHKAVLSSRILLPDLHVDVGPPPTLMTIYGEYTRLGFAKLGDQSWTDVNTPYGNFYDVLYHKEKFYGVDCFGEIYMCDIDHAREGGPVGTKITTFPGTHRHEHHKYLVESLCGSYMYFVVRVHTWRQGMPRYLTTKFSIWKFRVDYDGSDIPSYKWAKVRNLKNNAIFVGKTTSLCVRATGCINPNCIYFTDDYIEGFLGKGGGYDMGIYNVKTRTIKPHFRGLSIHLSSPPLWYI